MNKRLVYLLCIIILIGGAAFYFYNHPLVKKVKKEEATFATKEESDKYVRFDMEVFDKISKVYWQKTTPDNLATLFQLSLQKVLSTTTPILTKDRAGTAQMLSFAFNSATSTEAKKQLAINIATVALFNLAPAGRDQIFSQKQETAFRETVSNINPAKNLYEDLGLIAGASIAEVEKSYNQKIALLKNATSTEDKDKLAKIKYSHSVLANADSKALYDTAKIEPTLNNKKIGSTLYLDLRQVAPTSLYEMVKIIDNASTTNAYDTLIVDLRGNIGGSLDFLPAFLGLFIGKDEYAFDFYGQDGRIAQRTTQPKYPEMDKFKEIAILTDNMTQSTAEITSSTFKRFHIAKIVGSTTRGWGTIENTYPLDTEIDPSEKYVLLLVNSITLREDGQPIEGRGVDPDININDKNWQLKLNSTFKSQSLISAIKQVLK
jgi:C-terminal processing protease CtpA/Prc